jgi:hypothetical protein
MAPVVLVGVEEEEDDVLLLPLSLSLAVLVEEVAVAVVVDVDVEKIMLVLSVVVDKTVRGVEDALDEATGVEEADAGLLLHSSFWWGH